MHDPYLNNLPPMHAAVDQASWGILSYSLFFHMEMSDAYLTFIILSTCCCTVLELSLFCLSKSVRYKHRYSSSQPENDDDLYITRHWSVIFCLNMVLSCQKSSLASIIELQEADFSGEDLEGHGSIQITRAVADRFSIELGTLCAPVPCDWKVLTVRLLREDSEA
ncbi:hypothetical protein HAX54_020815 [Datura stramonium]|uniref:Uncharacterized protein n=1 Tax=Datura stramonium TaxID=4076 RepID=A0ABS8S2S3_DATST|nr:hypothetical protein [Datura stramonium]